ncbi:3-deoxy-7-phosphoheptulonate synthase [Blastocladiella britannica]|nr:3-deoxy-7-phosphoheptulonate synthase [Blastocladiella britannica]
MTSTNPPLHKLPSAHLLAAAPLPPHTATADALSALDNTRIREIRPLLPPQILLEECPLTPAAAATVGLARDQVARIVQGADDRLLVVVGPCSIHDPTAALDYARRLHEYAAKSAGELLVVMRVYFEKPRTTIGWKGLINDPDLNGTYKINKGLRIARQLLVDINGKIGLPCAGECLDTLTPQFVADLNCWAAIGARTTASQVHRELASGLSMPVGFKNDTDGNVRVAADAILAASHPHHFLSVTKQGLSAIVATEGNTDCHLILRGGSRGPNYAEEAVTPVVESLTKMGIRPYLMIDASHGNSEKDHRRQPVVLEEVARQISETDSGRYIMGVMIESNIVEGRQDLDQEKGPATLLYGQSVTDACIDVITTFKALDGLREAVLARRARTAQEKIEN